MIYPSDMYAKFFGLSQDPFSIAPDPRYLYMSERHREALAHLLYGLGGGGGFVLLSGEIGTGKTTVCRCFLEQIPANCKVAYIFNPKLSVPELLRSVCDEFHIALPVGAASAKDFIDPLNDFLLQSHAAGQNSVLIIDEAQNLSADVLEQLRLLTNLETNERKLLQIVLIGQPELRRMLARPELEQLAQRVIARFHLEALSAAETAHYITHRLAVAGRAGASPFAAKAVARIHTLSRGIPRRVNLLCGRALLGAYASGKAEVDPRTVDKAAAEVFGPDIRATPAPAIPGGSGWSGSQVALAGIVCMLTGAALVAAALWGLGGSVRVTERLSSAASLSAPAQPINPAAPAPAAAAGSSALPSGMPAASAAAAAVTLAGATGTVAITGTVTAPSLAGAPPIATLQSAAEVIAALDISPASAGQAWQVLGQAWGVTLSGPGDCALAAQQKVLCFITPKTPLPMVRELDRPGIITLFDGSKRVGQVVLAGLAPQHATLRHGTSSFQVALPALAELWRGDFATLRRMPDGLDNKAAQARTGPPLDWLAAQLDKAKVVPGAAADVGNPALPPLPGLADARADAVDVRRRISAFQLAHGLVPDGQAGAMTLMQLNRATGVDEPRLTAGSR